MVELQESLIAIGGVIVAGVVAYNKWQEWRAKKSVDQAFSTAQDDVLMGEGSSPHRQEPVLSPFEGPDLIVEPSHSGGLHAPQAAAIHPTADHHQESSAHVDHSVAPSTHRRSPLDPLIDCIIPVRLDAPLRGEKVSQAFHHLHLVGTKLVKVVGQNDAGQWEPVAVGGVYHELQVGVQMATRSGALTELEFSELASRLDQMADDLGASPELPDMSQTIATARSLHQRVHDFDAQLSINVRATAAVWPIPTLKTALQRQGMELRPDGKLVMPDGEGGQLFTASINANAADDNSSHITLLLPVAMVAPDRGGFKAMTAFAKSLASRLSGVVVDDEGHPLPDAALAGIAEDLGEFYREMEQAGIPAGSPLALRLFA